MNAEVAVLSDARMMILNASAEQAKDFRDRAEAYEVYAKAGGLRDEYHKAGAAKLWAEWRLGRLRLETSPKRVFDESVGIQHWLGRKWERLGQIPEDKFARVLSDIEQKDGAFNAGGVLGRSEMLYETRVDRGIYRLPDGRLVLQYKRDGAKRRETLNHHDVSEARRVLVERMGKAGRKPKGSQRMDISVAYSDVRHALWVLDSPQGLGSATPEARAHVTKAIEHLHRAEDEISAAIAGWTRSALHGIPRAENAA